MSPAQIVIDDSVLLRGNPGWETTQGRESWYNGTSSTLIKVVPNEERPALEVTFDGESLTVLRLPSRNRLIRLGHVMEIYGTATEDFVATYTRRRTKLSSFNVTFTGSSIAVYGVLNSVPGKLSVRYEVGDVSRAIQHFDGTQMIDKNWTLSHRLFSQDLGPSDGSDGEPKEHTLKVTVEEVTDQQL